jgi:hypothetical protein
MKARMLKEKGKKRTIENITLGAHPLQKPKAAAESLKAAKKPKIDLLEQEEVRVTSPQSRNSHAPLWNPPFHRAATDCRK